MPNPNSLCLLSTGFGLGGAEMQVANLARGLRARGWTIHLVSMIHPGETAERLRAEGFEVHSLEMTRGVPDPRALLRFARLLRRWRPDVLHCHMVHANLFGRLARLLARVPVVVCTAHNVNEGGRVREWAYRATDRLADVTTNVSEAAVRRYVAVGAVPAHRVQCIPNGVETARFRHDAAARARIREELDLHGCFVWLAVGRLEPPKDYPTLLRAFALVAPHAQTRLLIVGKGTLEARCRALAEELGLESQLRFLGARNDIPAVMSASDGYVMSSALEGLPMVLLEAAASGLPIVATDVGGNGEVVRDGATGLLRPSGDASALGQAMLTMISLSPAERSAMGEAARRLAVDRYGMDEVLTRWESTYQQLFGRGSTESRRSGNRRASSMSS